MTATVHWDDVRARVRHNGDIHASWYDLGTAAGSDRIGLKRIRIEPGRRSTPAHIHGAEEEIFFVLSGDGLLWQDGATCRVGPGEPSRTVPCPRRTRCGPGPAGSTCSHSARASRSSSATCRGRSTPGPGPVVLPVPGFYDLFPLDDAAGDFDFPEPGERFPTSPPLRTSARSTRPGRPGACGSISAPPRDPTTRASSTSAPTPAS